MHLILLFQHQRTKTAESSRIRTTNRWMEILSSTKMKNEQRSMKNVNKRAKQDENTNKKEAEEEKK